MRLWDLHSNAAHLELAMETLQTVSRDVAELWDDPSSRKFQEEYLLPLDEKVRRALDAIHRLSELLTRAEQECG